jgi:hypothetical protein
VSGKFAREFKFGVLTLRQQTNRPLAQTAHDTATPQR